MPQIIAANTTWHSGAVINISDTVQIAPGVTLTIEPGVVVSGGTIQTFGALVAIGTAGQTIAFNNVRFIFGENVATPGSLRLDYADLTGCQLLPATGNASYGQVNVSNSLIQESPTYSYLWYNEAGSVFSRNALIDHSLSIGTSESFSVVENAFFDTSGSDGRSAITDWAAYGPAVQVVGNSFQLLGRAALELPEGYTSTAINAPGNYFGTTNTSFIADLILDRTDSLSRASVISVSPVLSSPATDTPFWGSMGSDTWHGGSDANRAWGNEGSDRLIGGGGDDRIEGGQGTDVAVFSGSRSGSSVSFGFGDSIQVVDGAGPDGIDTLLGIERLEFADRSVNLTVGGLANTISTAQLNSLVELYIAYINRVPDADGMAFWINQLKAGQTLNQIGESFYSAAVQFGDLTGYSAAMSNADFVTVVYRNVLGRSDPDAGGLAFWSNELATGHSSRGTLVASVLDSAHTFKGNATYGYVADLLDNKISVGKLFAIEQGLVYNTSEDSISYGMQIAAAITSTSTEQAISLIGVNDGFSLLG